MKLKIPLNRKPNPDGLNLNVGTEHITVPVWIDPNLTRRGEYAYQYDYSRVIRLREWNEQVLLHEILHAVIEPLGLGTPDDPFAHNVISRVEVALWETGWRISKGENDE